MESTPAHVSASVRALLEQARLSEDETRQRLRNAADSRYWKALSPRLSVEGNSNSMDGTPVTGVAFDELLQQFDVDGYFRTGPVVARAVVGAMAECVDTLRKERWPPVFAFVYDEFWALFRSAPLVQLLSATLGPGYVQNSNVWCHFVPAARGVGGWPPHMDNFKEDRRVNVWVPLTDATVDNGCIYVIPRSRVPGALADTDFKRFDGITFRDLQVLLQSTRALPAEAGSFLAWDFQLIHWGSISRAGVQPRVSLAVEFISGEADVAAYEDPVFEASGSLPNLGQRLHSIGKSLLSYQRFEPLMSRYEELARRLVSLDLDAR